MDTVIAASVRKRTTYKWLITGGAVLLLLGAGVWLLRYAVSSSISRSVITTAVVEKGNIENTLTATGEVLPEFEEVITSPINASVQQVALNAGSTVKAGESLLTLDKSATQTSYEKLKFQLESKRNDIKKLRLQLDKSFYDIKSNNDIKQLQINSLEADVENARRLYKAGGGTREDIEKAELNLKVARLEKLQLENEIKSKQQTMQVEMREAEIAAAIQDNELQELQRKLQQANVVASRDGVITWINRNIGAVIHEGDALARIADLNSFKVQGSISDNYLDQLHKGMAAIVRMNELQIRGTVINIQPAVQNGIITFDVQLNERNHPLLHPNLKVDVYLVTAAQNNVLRVANGPAFRGAATQDIFIIRHQKAERVAVHIGMSNFDYVELKDHVKPGDVVITNDMSNYKNAQTLTLTP
ncbi:HlyD family secretion protein [Chitinophaga costaii]|uniref:HlyD family secretion protein n=1 Tax=Chitinophaga costaii TaxID=1335309 RepID=A0A1C3YP60_9BACT|nr:HlyD family efflux transporter periplasmic adaptor subunit [Chitinophaga costaii]PUZ30029.1 efflux transporter periplasmic adaptor subunit [Chitinophaga costaii]SCB71818.1 HlyD family secretion protein [Chitinophaga costaii]